MRFRHERFQGSPNAHAQRPFRLRVFLIQFLASVEVRADYPVKTKSIHNQEAFSIVHEVKLNQEAAFASYKTPSVAFSK